MLHGRLQRCLIVLVAAFARVFGISLSIRPPFDIRNRLAIAQTCWHKHSETLLHKIARHGQHAHACWCATTQVAASVIDGCNRERAWPDGHEEIFEGRVHGNLTWPPRGNLGFGYDPVFVPTGRTQTFAELDPAEKHAMSHRADAFKKLIEAVF